MKWHGSGPTQLTCPMTGTPKGGRNGWWRFKPAKNTRVFDEDEAMTPSKRGEAF